MRKILFSFALLTTAALFSFCAKEEASSTSSVQTLNDNAPIVERGPCDVSVVTTGPITFCGLRQNQATCTSCCNVSVIGLTNLPSLSGSSVNIQGFGPNNFYIKNTGLSTVTVTVTTSVNSIQYTIKPGECAIGSVSETCLVSQLATHC